jgi:diguanylate cyclase (GGDEF)-like protein
MTEANSNATVDSVELDTFDRLAELVVGLLDATGEEIEQALASGVAEVAGAGLAFVETPTGETWWPDLPDEATADGMRALARSAGDRDEVMEEFGWKLGVPLRGDASPVGASAVSRNHPFAMSDRIALSRSGVAIGKALLRLGETEADRRRISELEDLAFCDENTGLANRRALLAALAQQENADPLSLLLLDFDGLRAVNNELSYEHGNELLRTVAACIERTLRENEFAARLHGSGGDEFIVVCPGAGEAHATVRARQLEQALAKVDLPPEIAELYGGASAGYAVRVAGEQPLDLVERRGDPDARAQTRTSAPNLRPGRSIADHGSCSGNSGKRRGRDLNPRGTFQHLRDFQSRSLDRSDTSPRRWIVASVTAGVRAASCFAAPVRCRRVDRRS